MLQLLAQEGASGGETFVKALWCIGPLLGTMALLWFAAGRRRND